MIPTFILQMWLLGLLSLGVITAAICFAHEWLQRSWGWNEITRQSIFQPDFGWNMPTLLLAAAILLALIAVVGSQLLKAILIFTSRKKPRGEPDPRVAPTPVSEQRLPRPDGSEVQVRFYGPEDGPPIILTHGWGLHGAEWNYLQRELADTFRLIVWDEPGLGKSKRPSTSDYRVEKFATDLQAVLALAGDRPAILLGHSIGGMITLTFCRLFPEALGSRVAGLVLTHTTPTNPVRTTSGAAFFTAIEKPVLVPLMYLTMVLSPLIWIMNWLSYLNGSAHLSNKSSSFGGTQTWEQLDFATRFQPQASPAVLARGMLGMMQYDAIPTLPSISIPALVVVGNRDSTTIPEAGRQIHEQIPNAQFVTLAPAKHLGLIEHHAEYARAVREFATAVQPKSRRKI